MERWQERITRDLRQQHSMWAIAGRPGPAPLELLENVDFSGARFSGVTFDYATIKHCFFSDTGIEYANFKRTHLIDCWATTANLSHCDFDGADIERCKFPRTDFRWSRLTGDCIVNSEFEASAFANSWFIGTKVSGCSFRDSGFAAAQIDKSHFVDCDFRQALLSGSSNQGRAFETHFENCDFRNANFEHRRFRDTTFTRCKFAGITGDAVIESSVHVVEPDFSADGDGSDIRTAEALLAMWSRNGEPK